MKKKKMFNIWYTNEHFFHVNGSQTIIGDEFSDYARDDLSRLPVRRSREVVTR